MSRRKTGGSPLLLNEQTNKYDGIANDDGTESLLVTSLTDAVGGAIKILAGDGSARALPRFAPVTNDYAGIVAAATIAASFGGGIVQLSGVVYDIGTNTIPLMDGVTYEGMGCKINGGGFDAGSTVIKCALTNDAFYISQSTSIRNFGVKKLGILNPNYGIRSIRSGTAGTFPHTQGNFEDIEVTGAQSWSYWFENFDHHYFSMCRGDGKLGGAAWVNSNPNWNGGNSTIIRCGGQVTAMSGIPLLFLATAGNLNNIEGYGLVGFTNNISSYNMTATISSGTSTWTLVSGDTSKLVPGMPFYLEGYNSDLFFINTVLSPTTFNLSRSAYAIGSANAVWSSPFNEGGKTMHSFGFPNIWLQGLQPCTFSGLDIEGASTCQVYALNCNNIKVDVEFAYGNTTWPDSTVPYGVCCTNVTGYSEIRHPSASNLKTYLDNGSWSTHISMGIITNSGRGQGFYANTDPAQNTSFGIPTGQNGNGCISLAGYNIIGMPDIYINEATRALGFSRGVLYRQQLVAATANLPQGNYSPPIQVFNGAAGQTLTLPTIIPTGATQNIGLIQEIMNPTANAVTIAVAGGTQNIIGDGLKANTFSLVSQKNARFIACTDGTNPFWAKI